MTMKKSIYIFSILFIAAACSEKTAGTVSTVKDAEVKMPTMELAEGKHIYNNDCTKCHAPEPVEKYTQEQWNKIIPNMAIKAKLTPEKTALVQSYVSWELVN